MKKLLLSLGLISAMAPALMAETYTWPTTPMPDNAVWSPATAAPGLYKEMSGRYQCNVSAAYVNMYSTPKLPTGVPCWVVDDNNEIVYNGTMKYAGLGMRNGSEFYMDIPESDAITEAGTYYIIFPAAGSPDQEGQVQLAGTGEIGTIYNLKAGPYIIGDVGDPVDADITVTPSGVFIQPEGISSVIVTVNNAYALNASNLANDMDEFAPTITVTGPSGVVDMIPGVKEANQIKWEFPIEDDENSAKLENGLYSVTINYETFSGYTESLNPLVFPSEPVTYTFTVEGGVSSLYTPQILLSPNVTEFETWTAKTLGISLIGSSFDAVLTDLRADVPVLTIIDPDGNSYEPVGAVRGLNAIGYTIADADFFSKPGEYNCYWKIGGRKGKITATSEIVTFDNVSFAYFNTTMPSLAPEVYQYQPKEVQDKYSSNVVYLELPGVTIDGIVAGLGTYPELEIIKPSGEVYTTSTLGIRIGRYAYKIDTDVFDEAGTYKATWKLAGWTGTVATTETEAEHQVNLLDVSFAYQIGTPAQPEEPTVAGTTVVPAPGEYKEIDGLKVSFGPDFLADFNGWTEEFSGVATVTKEGETEGKTYQPTREDGGMTIAYDIQIPESAEAHYTIVIDLWLQKYYVLTNARASETAYVPSEKAWLVLDYTVDKTVGVDEIANGEASAVYFDLNGNRLNSKPDNGLYIRVSNGKSTKVIK